MAIPIFQPIPGPSFGIQTTHNYRADISTSHKGYDLVRPIGLRRLPAIQVTWDALTKPEMDRILGFFDSLGGTTGPFYYQAICSITGPEGIYPELSEVAGGSLTSQPEYFVRMTWYDSGNGTETTGSREANRTVADNFLLTVKVPPLPLSVTEWRVYVGVVTGDTDLQTGTETSRVWTMPAGGVEIGGAAPPSENTLQPYKIYTFNGTLEETMIAPGLYSLSTVFQEQSAAPL